MKGAPMNAAATRDCIQGALTGLQGCLEVVGLLDQRDALKAEIATLQGQLKKHSATVEAKVSELGKVVAQHEVAHGKTVESRAKTVEGLEKRIEDLVGQKTALEARVEEVRGFIASAQAEGAAVHERQEIEASNRMRMIEQRRDAAKAELEGLQAKIRDFHQGLAKVAS